MKLSATNLMMLLAALILVAAAAVRMGGSPETVPFSQFTNMVEAGEISEVAFDGTQITGRTTDAEGHPRDVHTVAVPGDESLVKTLQEKGVAYGAHEARDCGEASVLLTLLLIGLLGFSLIRPGAGAPPGVATFGKSQAKLAPEEGTGVTFKDVAGIDEAEEELNEIVQFLKTPERFTRLGGKIPKGVLLVGPPGTGKTLLARAVAGEAAVPFFSISGSDFVEMFVGVGAARVRDLFKQASDRAPCIIFIDELDAIGKARGLAVNGGDTERDQTLNQLLVEMDGFDGRKGVIILAATNRPEVLDQALLRAGRFDRQIVVDTPDVRGREAILKVHARSMRIAKDVDLRVVAQRTSGFTGADLANTLNEAALLAARRGKDEIGFVEIDDAVERLSLGAERKSRIISDSERRMTAYHEAGHAICGAAMPQSLPVSKISIIPRGMTGGVTRYTPPEGRIGWARQELIARLVTAYGGMAAEEEYVGDVTTGAQNDIAQASSLARRMVSEYGMSERLGAINYGTERPSPFGFQGAARDVPIADETAREIDAEVKRILEWSRNKARELVREHRASLEAITRALLEKETLDGEALAAYLAPVMPAPGTSGNVRVLAERPTSQG